MVRGQTALLKPAPRSTAAEQEANRKVYPPMWYLELAVRRSHFPEDFGIFRNSGKIPEIRGKPEKSEGRKLPSYAQPAVLVIWIFRTNPDFFGFPDDFRKGVRAVVLSPAGGPGPLATETSRSW